MAKRGRKRKNTKSKQLTAVLLLIITIVAIILGRNNESFEKANITANSNVTATTSELVKVHFIDVGQGSSTLVQCGNTGILIDAGEREYGKTVVKYLKDAGIKRLEYVVASHPHSDHIGGLFDVLDSIYVKNIIMPKLTDINIPTTRIYEKLLETISDKNINAIYAKLGNRYTVGAAAIDIIGPVEQVKDLNNMSVICKVTANKVKFLVTADAEKQEMSSVYNATANLKSDIIVMGHHGSRTAIQKDFLKSAGARVAIVSCGKDNPYNHPHKETIEYLKNNNIEYYRTDLVGNIVFTCNDKGYAIDCSKDSD